MTGGGNTRAIPIIVDSPIWQAYYVPPAESKAGRRWWRRNWICGADKTSTQRTAEIKYSDIWCRRDYKSSWIGYTFSHAEIYSHYLKYDEGKIRRNNISIAALPSCWERERERERPRILSFGIRENYSSIISSFPLKEGSTSVVYTVV